MDAKCEDAIWLANLSKFCETLESSCESKQLWDGVLPDQYQALNSYRMGIDRDMHEKDMRKILRSARGALKKLQDRQMISFTTDQKRRPFYEKPLLHALTLAVEHGL